ncbi:MAG: UDP-N-acetylglucosamine 2-epimerase (hydrolyzing) [Bdellovibrionales bacterium]|nr:UDP-N-acetylglucosamine 2-epimerase (hydrolyzing) [Bdellovibrionales bacterium]
MNLRKVCVVTGSRADYGLLQGLLEEIRATQGLDLRVAVTGMHLSPRYGNTFDQIEKDGFQITHRVDVRLDQDTHLGISRSVGLGVSGFAEVFDKDRPDLVVVLGDRFEILAATQAAMLARIPIAHIHGGEITEGAVDESIRHAITKMANLHFVTADAHRKRVIQMGENPAHVFNTGAPGLDFIRKAKLLSRAEFEAETGFLLGAQNFLVTFHPVTLGTRSSKQSLADLLLALDSFPDAHLIFTRPNADADGRVISEMIDDYVSKAKQRRFVATSLGQIRYLSAMKNVQAVIGNSSSGIIEAPALKVATVNIGDRQKGRLSGPSVIHSADDAASIVKAIQKALSPQFQQQLATVSSLYGDGHASAKICQQIASVHLHDLQRKPFFDQKGVVV